MKRFKKWLNKLGKAGLVGVVLLTLILINYIASFFPLRLDLTENKIYSLSSATRETLGNLDDIVTVKLYISDDIPNRLLPIRREAESLTAAYKQAGGSNFRSETIAPETQEEQQEAQMAGVPQLQFSGIQQDKLEVTQGFFGAAIEYAGETESIPVLEEDANLEYQFTSAINRLTREELPKVALAAGHGERDDLSTARELLSRDFSVTTQNLSTASAESIELNEKIDALLILGSGDIWHKEEKDALREFASKGKSILFALDGVEVGSQLTAEPVEHNLNDFLSEYGLKLESDLIVSASNDVANFRTPQGVFVTPYPFWVRIGPDGFNQDIAPLTQLQTAVFPWVSSVRTSSKSKAQNSKADEVVVFKFINTVKESYSQEENFNLSPNQEFEQNWTGKKTVAAASEVESQKSEPGRIVLIGDSDFVSDRVLQQARENAVLFLNLVDWLTSDTALSGIRARQSSFRPLMDLNATARAAVKYGAVLATPVLFGIFGAARLRRRN